MLRFWMRPSVNQHMQEQSLLTLDALGKFSLIDSYVLILFVVAFRFHLAVSENLSMDVYVTPEYGFFSFLVASCLSLILGHAALFYHRRIMEYGDANSGGSSKLSILNHEFKARNENSPKRLSRVVQALLLLTMVSTLGLLLCGFVKNCFTFEIGGLAGIMLGEDSSRTSYSVLSLGTALPSSVENPQSLSIVFLQAIYFFFTIVTPILCLMILILLMIIPMTLKWQRCCMVAAEIARSWSAIEVFLLSILAALLQISTFASFMIGDKCGEINMLAQEIFEEEDVETVCFTVDASVESNCWSLLVGTFLNSLLVSFCLRFTQNVLDERMEGPLNTEGERSSPDVMTSSTKQSRALVRQLIEFPFIGRILFVAISNSNSVSEEAVTPLENLSVD